MLSREEREERKKQIGASEVYKLLNFDNQDCQQLWELKVGLRDYEDINSDAITAGNILEEDGLNYYAESNNVEIVSNERIEHKTIKGLVVSLDAREKNTSIPIENKTINEDTWNNWIAKRSYNAVYGDLKLNIPKSYYCQLQIQISVLEVKKGVLNVNTLTDEEQEDPINVIIGDLHNKQVIIYKDDDLIYELESRAIYMLECMKYKLRPSERDYLEKKVF